MPWWCSGLAYGPVEAVTRVQNCLSSKERAIGKNLQIFDLLLLEFREDPGRGAMGP